jgi:outer membrane protein OmpA-like peptidoglycan-associated protein
MPNLISRSLKILSLSLLSFFSHQIFAQKAGLEVTRCSAVDRALTLKNVAVDASGRKWAANSNGIFQVKAADLATPLKVAAGEKNVLAYRGGNADFAWSEAAFKRQVSDPCTVTAAWYDSKTQQLWLGTDEAGLFQLSTQPELKLMQQYKTVNSKLKSNRITHIFQDASARLWVGTDQGLMYGTPGRWKAELAGTNVQRVREYNTVIYALAEGFISKAPGGEKWSDLALEEKYLEGDINDFDIDPSGKMWLVSGILTRYDLLANTYDAFGGAEYYTSQYGNCIAVDTDGAAWVGTEDKGLYVVDKAYNMVLNAYVEKPISCDGNGKDAILMAKITGGVPPYTYTWSGGLTGESPQNVGAGNYSVTVTDSKGKARSAEIGLPDARLKVKARQKKPISAPGMADGAGEVDLASNASGIVVLWDNGETLATANKLTAGEHSVTVTDPKGCSTVLKVTISEVAVALSASISEKSKVKCAGGNAALAVEPKGGKGPFKYTWSNPALTGEAPSNVPAGDYTVTITDAVGGTATATFSVKQPEPLTASALVQAPASTGGSDGKALAQAKGGTGVYTFKWDNGETVFAATKLPAGTHTLTVSDANACNSTASFTILENVLALSANISEKTSIKCGGEKAVLSVSVKGGKGPFKYVWSNPALVGDAPANVAAGSYQVTVSDAAGTTAAATFNVKSPQPLSASAIPQGVVSPGGSDGKALVSTTGGTGAHTFAWDNGEVTAATVRLSPGLHTVTVTDENACTTTATVTLSEGALPLSASISEKNSIKCAGEKTALAVSVAGGKGPFKYVWSAAGLTGESPTSVAAGSYQVTVTDAAGTTSSAAFSVKSPEPLSVSLEVQAPASTGKSDGKALAKVAGGTGSYTFKWENGENSATAARLAPGTSKVVVTDANGCTSTASVNISENILPLSVSISEKNSIRCAGEKTTLAVSVAGGKGPFKYVWSAAGLTGESPTSVAAGSYQVTVTDAAGTTATATFSVKSPEPLSVSVEVQAPASTGKSDGKALAKVAGGSGAYIFQWDSGESSNTAVRLAPGMSKVVVTDANGCTSTASVNISENILPLSVSISEKNMVKCAGEKAALTVKVGGGKPPFAFAWSNPALAGDAPEGVEAGEYTLTVTDAKGLSQSANVSVKIPAPFAVELARNLGVTTPTSNDGKAQVSVKGGTTPYSIVWDTKQTGTTVNKLALGAHSVTVSDAAGCTQKVDFETSRRAMPELTRAIENGQTIQMRLLNFGTDSSSLKPSMLPVLDELYDFLVVNPTISIEVGGHTNNQPKDDFADYLSTARAKSVAEYLTGKGVAAERVQFKGYGKRQPIAPNTTPEGRRANQRVEIKILSGK